MRCPNCGTKVPDDTLTCPRCGADVGLTALASSGQQFGPYTLRQLRQYLAERRLDTNSQVSIAGRPPVPVSEVLGVSLPMEAPGTAPPPPGAVAPPAQPPRRIVSGPEARRRKRTAWLAVLGCVGLLILLGGLLAAMLLPAVRRQQAHANQTRCLSNVKQGSLAMLMYAQDYDERFPPDTNFETTLYPYVRNAQIFVCPSAQSPPSYGMNAGLCGLHLTMLSQPAQTTMLYDSTAEADLVGRHNNGNNVGFADGHVKWYKVGSVKQYMPVKTITPQPNP